MTQTSYPFRDSSLPVEERISDLISRLTLEEKTELLRYDSPAIPRLGIPEYNWWNEALHGVGRNGHATVFPQAINLAATWNKLLVKETASCIADEARAKYHEAERRGSRQQYQGLTFWTPNINIFRDPRWGRGQETWGEDPCLTSELGCTFMQGLQGDDPRYLKTAACAKHFAVHSGPEALRHEFDACPPKKDFYETYLPAFERLAKAGVESFMGAYNRTYGEPCCGSRLLLVEILREQWDFQGHVVSDCWAIKDFHEHHKVTKMAEESAALALKNGCDLNCGTVYCDALLTAVKMGLCSEHDVEISLRRLLRTLFKLGMFDPAAEVPYTAIPKTVIACDKHRELAHQTALQSIILLKNAHQALPISPNAGNMLIVGPNAANVEVMLGNYFGLSSSMSTLIEGIAEVAPEGLRIDYRRGCRLDRPADNDLGWAAFEGAKADYIVAAMGLTPNHEGEEGDAVMSPHRGDRVDIGLPEAQKTFLTMLAKRIRMGGSPTKLILVLFGGSAIAEPEIFADIDAVIHAGYPGESGGKAIAEILFGIANPSAKLPFTIPSSVDDLPPYEDYSMEGRTYRYMDESKILYPFGFGLSYTQYEYTQLELKQIENDDLLAEVVLKNTGTREGVEVVQIYAQCDLPEHPRFRLVGFEACSLKAGEEARISIVIPKNMLRLYDASGNAFFAQGKQRFFAGGSAPLECSFALGAPKGQWVDF